LNFNGIFEGFLVNGKSIFTAVVLAELSINLKRTLIMTGSKVEIEKNPKSNLLFGFLHVYIDKL